MTGERLWGNDHSREGLLRWDRPHRSPHSLSQGFPLQVDVQRQVLIQSQSRRQVGQPAALLPIQTPVQESESVRLWNLDLIQIPVQKLRAPDSGGCSEITSESDSAWSSDSALGSDSCRSSDSTSASEPASASLVDSVWKSEPVTDLSSDEECISSLSGCKIGSESLEMASTPDSWFMLQNSCTGGWGTSRDPDDSLLCRCSGDSCSMGNTLSSVWTDSLSKVPLKDIQIIIMICQMIKNLGKHFINIKVIPDKWLFSLAPWRQFLQVWVQALFEM